MSQKYKSSINQYLHTVRQHKQNFYRRLSGRKTFILLTVVPALLLFLFLNALPILWAIVGSFYSLPAFSTDWTFIGFDNYVKTIQDPSFWSSFQLSAIYASGCVVIQLIVGVAAALLANRGTKFATLTRTIVILPYLIPTAVLGFLAVWMGNSQRGVINQILEQLSLISGNIAWFGNPDHALIAVVLTTSWKYTFFVSLMVLARLQSIPDSLYEAATMCGASSYEKFRDITLPNLKGVIFIVVLLRGIWMFNQFDIIWVLTRGGPGTSTTIAPIYAYLIAFRELLVGQGSSISVILFGILVVVAIGYFAVLEPSQEVEVE